MENDQIIVVQETEYTGAGKNPTAQLTFAMQNGIKILVGNPDDEIPGQNIILPEHPSMIKAREVYLLNLKKSYIKNCIQHFGLPKDDRDIKFLAEDTKSSQEFVREIISEL